MSSMNRWRANMVLLACLVIIIAAVHVGCHLVEDDEDDPDEDVLLWSHEVTAEDVYVYFDEEAGELLLVTGSGIWSMDLAGQAEVQLEQLAEIADPAAESRFTGLPYVTRCDAGERRITWVLERGPDYIVSEITGDGVDVYMQQEAGERYSEEVPYAHFFVPVMLLEQHYRFTHQGRWYELATVAEDERPRGYTYTLHLSLRAGEPEGPYLDAPGYAVRHFEDGLSVWVAQPGLDPQVYNDAAREAVDEGWDFFGLSGGLPLHVVVGPHDHLVWGMKYQGMEVSHWSRRYARASVQVQRLYSLRHEIMHGVHHYALKMQGQTRNTLPWWLNEGVADYFGYGGSPRPRLRAYQSRHFTCLDDSQTLLEQRDLRSLGMVTYLVDEFGRDRVAEYSTVYRDAHGWHAEDALTVQYFDMTQGEILWALYNEPPEIVQKAPRPDYVVSEWEELTRADDANRGFSLSADGDKIAIITVGSADILLLDLETLEVRQVFSARDHEGMDVVGTLAWFPCGERIAFMGREDSGVNDIYVLDLKEGTHESFIASDAVDSGPHVSPCGERIAFRSERTGYSEIYAKDMDTGETTQLTHEQSTLTWPVYSEDGDRLAFVDNGRDLLGIMDTSTRDITWTDLQPHAVLTPSRPRWVSEEELVFPVDVYGAGNYAPISVNVIEDEVKVYGGMELTAYWVEPAASEDQFYISTQLWEGQHIVRVTFEPGE